MKGVAGRRGFQSGDGRKNMQHISARRLDSHSSRGGGRGAPPGSLYNLHGSEWRQALQGSLTFSINSQLPKPQENTAAGDATKQEEASEGREERGGRGGGSHTMKVKREKI